MSDMDQFKEIFLEEASEYVIELNDTLLALEQDMNKADLIHTLFRIMHTLKSSAAAVGYKQLSELSHKTESLLQKIRDGNFGMSEEFVELLFNVADEINNFIQDLTKNHSNKKYDYSQLISKIEKIGQVDKVKSKKKRQKKTNSLTIQLSEEEKQTILQLKKKGEIGYRLNVEIDEKEQMKWLRAELLLNNIAKLGTIVGIRPEKEKFLEPTFDGKFIVFLTAASDEQSVLDFIKIDLLKKMEIKKIVLDKDVQTNTKTQEKKGRKQYDVSLGQNTLRVSIDKLNELMNLSGELVVAISGLRIFEKKISNDNLPQNIVAHLVALNDKISNLIFDLQNKVMHIRMVPVSQLFLKFHRVVRDIAKDENKKIKLVLSGEETELDKKVIDSIGEAMMHLIRNAIDHGIETPQERKKKGKSEEGTILLTATQTGNHIVLTIRDDGEGIDTETIKNKAIQKGLLDSKSADELPKEQLINYLFEPGFSTSNEITEISGRGVGLDVVKSVVETMSGSIKVETELHQYTQFTILLPLTLASTSVILVKESEQLFAIPIQDIEESIKVAPENIQTMEGRPVIQLRNMVLPLIYLADIFDLPHSETQDKLPIVVVNIHNKKIGIVVKQILRKEEIVLKSLSSNYKSIQGIAGGAVLGDGSIVLVIDVFPLWEVIKNSNVSKMELENEN